MLRILVERGTMKGSELYREYLSLRTLQRYLAELELYGRGKGIATFVNLSSWIDPKELSEVLERSECLPEA